MTLKKNFLHNEPRFFVISRFKIIVGLVIGLSYSFVLYLLLYLTREAFRILSVTETYDMWILADKEVHFYNLFFAFISVIYAQSVTFTFWLDRPKQLFGKLNHRKTSIINDQRVLIWNFFSWFSKLAFIFGLMFGFAYSGSFYTFSLYPNYNYIFILIIIVLFFQTWNNIRLVFKRKSLKWMLYSMIIISVFSFGLSKINPIDYKLLNDKYLGKSIGYNYQLELPESNFYERLERLSLVENIYLVERKEQQLNLPPVIICDNEEISYEKLHDIIIKWRSARNEFEIPIMTFQLHIHRDIKMKFVNQLKNELLKSNVFKIAYAVVPTNPVYDKRYYNDYSFTIMLHNWNAECLYSKGIYNEFASCQNIIEIKQTDLGLCYINNSKVETTQIKRTIKRLIQEDPDYVIKYFINDNVDFSSYFKVISLSKEAVNELRNEYSEKKYSMSYNQLYDEEVRIVKHKYPFRIFELTEELTEEMMENIGK